MPKRYIFAVMAMFGIMTSFMMRGCLSIAITQMVNPNSGRVSAIHIFLSLHLKIRTLTFCKQVNVFDWSEKTQGIIFSSFYWGYIIIHVPGGTLAEKFGGKNVFGFSLLFSSLFTLITPWTANQGAYLLSLSRFLKGFSEVSNHDNTKCGSICCAREFFPRFFYYGKISTWMITSANVEWFE